jgi:hypothetical protein
MMKTKFKMSTICVKLIILKFTYRYDVADTVDKVSLCADMTYVN